MKYFARFLPVLGEIKEGDKALNPSNKKVVKVNVACLKHLVDDKWKKVKLFLCSRDIQIGDEYYNSIGYKVDHTWDEEAIQDFKDFPDNIFKVIGEISEDAIWVKEGDEFDEYKSLFRDEDGNIWKDKYGAGKMGYPGELFEICRVRCPTCKQFH